MNLHSVPRQICTGKSDRGIFRTILFLLLIFLDHSFKPGQRSFNHVVRHTVRYSEVAGTAKTTAWNCQYVFFLQDVYKCHIILFK